MRNEKQKRMRTAVQSSSKAKTDLINSMKTDQREKGKKWEKNKTEKKNICRSGTKKNFFYFFIYLSMLAICAMGYIWAQYTPFNCVDPTLELFGTP